MIFLLLVFDFCLSLAVFLVFLLKKEYPLLMNSQLLSVWLHETMSNGGQQNE